MNKTRMGGVIGPMTRDVSRAWGIMQDRCDRDRQAMETLSEAWVGVEDVKRRGDLARVRELLMAAVASVDDAMNPKPQPRGATR